MRKIRPRNDKVRVGDSRMMDIVGYGTLAVLFPGILQLSD